MTEILKKLKKDLLSNVGSGMRRRSLKFKGHFGNTISIKFDSKEGDFSYELFLSATEGIVDNYFLGEMSLSIYRSNHLLSMRFDELEKKKTQHVFDACLLSAIHYFERLRNEEGKDYFQLIISDNYVNHSKRLFSESKLLAPFMTEGSLSEQRAQLMENRIRSIHRSTNINSHFGNYVPLGLDDEFMEYTKPLFDYVTNFHHILQNTEMVIAEKPSFRPFPQEPYHAFFDFWFLGVRRRVNFSIENDTVITRMDEEETTLEEIQNLLVEEKEGNRLSFSIGGLYGNMSFATRKLSHAGILSAIIPEEDIEKVEVLLKEHFPFWEDREKFIWRLYHGKTLFFKTVGKKDITGIDLKGETAFFVRDRERDVFSFFDNPEKLPEKFRFLLATRD